MRPVLVVTGTDTDVGKTVATAALATLVPDPYVLKPAQTGVGPDEPGDLAEVRRLVGDVPGHEGLRLRDPLAPDTAARLEGAHLPDAAEIAEVVAGLADRQTVLLEGAGGVLVNVVSDGTLLEVADALAARGVRLSFVVVARAGLGTLNHATLTVQAIQGRGHAVAGVVVGSWPDEPGLAEQQNLIDLPDYTGVPLLGRIPQGAGSWDRDAFVHAAPNWLTLPS